MARTPTRTAALACSLLLTLALTGCSIATRGDPNNVLPDNALRHCIAALMQTTGVPFTTTTSHDPNKVDSLTQADLDALATATTTPYSIMCSSVASLDGLQNLHDPEFTKLDVFAGRITDLTPLTGLTTLSSLSLDANNIKNLTPLTGLTNLTLLDVGYNQITDLTPLATLTNLTTLSLNNNHITDLTPLTSLTNLTMLFLSGNPITDLTPLGKLPRLTSLHFDSNHLADLTPLAGLTQLQTLSLTSNTITDITPIAALLNQGCPSQGDCVRDFFGNHITDLSSLDWNRIEQNTLTADGQTRSGQYYFRVSNQTTQATSRTGTVALPTIIQAANDPHPIIWIVTDGKATIHSEDGTVTYPAAGSVTLSWTTDPTANDVGAIHPSAAPQSTTGPSTDNIDFSGSVVVTVTGQPGQRIATIVLIVCINLAVALVIAGVAFLAVRRTRRTR
ncbi:MAG: leucine-rich repeat domain-containing protein [Propionibacteriaceae bacterium]|nr:leucine-rich repeat domain-containing protein [Propionibacteriaceae bacterium]